MQGIYNYIPETKPVSRVYSVAPVLYLQFVLHVMLFHIWNVFCTFYTSTFWSICAVPKTAAFCHSLILCFTGMLLGYCLNDCEMVPVLPVIKVITFALIFHVHWISIIRSLYVRIFSFSFLITFLSPEISTLTYMYLFHYHVLWCPVYS